MVLSPQIPFPKDEAEISLKKHEIAALISARRWPETHRTGLSKIRPE